MSHDDRALPGKTIATTEVIKAEYGRTYRNYLCLTFTDGTRFMCGYFSTPPCTRPRPPIEEMKKAPAYFTVEDIAEEACQTEKDRREHLRQQEERELREFKRLQKKYKGQT